MTKQILSQAGIAEILTAVREVLTCGDADICDANNALLEKAIEHGLVNEDEINVG